MNSLAQIVEETSDLVVDPRFNFGLGRVDSKSLENIASILKSIPNDEELRKVFISLEKYVLQSVVRSISFSRKRTGVSSCLREKYTPDVAVVHYPVKGSYSYANLHVCGSVWVCPVCARKVSEKRGLEVLSAIKAHRGEFYGKSGGDNQLFMVTYTVPHSLFSSLVDVVDLFVKAFRWMKNQTSYKGNGYSIGLRSRILLFGTIRVLEVTWGEVNGWHVHIHELLFVQRSLQKTKISGLFYDDEGRLTKTYGSDGKSTYVIDEKGLFSQWKRAAERFGLGTPEPQGFDVQGADYAAEYVSKFGREPRKQLWLVSNELSKQHIKRNVQLHSDGTPKGYTPFDLLRMYFYKGDIKYLELFQEFATAFFGKKQLFWSPGLKKHFEIQSKTDEELAEELEEDAQFFGFLNSNQWEKILRFDARGTFLQRLEKYGWKDSLNYIENLG